MLPNPQETADLVIFTDKLLNGKLHFLCSVNGYFRIKILNNSWTNELPVRKVSLKDFCNKFFSTHLSRVNDTGCWLLLVSPV